MKVSIVTPSFNQGEFIERTLQSVASQTSAEIEHVVFDGGSTDNTVEILKRFTPPVRWVSKKDKGQTDAVNQGIRATDGEIIGWLNSDDIYYPGAIARVVAFFRAHPEVDLVYGMADHIDRDDRAIEPYPTEPWNLERLKETCFICQPALFFRRRVVEKYGLLDETLNYCMDYEYWLRLGKNGARFAYLEEKLAGSRMYAENKTMRATVKVHKEINGMLKKLWGRVPDKWLFNYAHVVVMQRFAGDDHSTMRHVNFLFYSLISALRWNRSISKDMRDFLKGRFKHWFNVCIHVSKSWIKEHRYGTRIRARLKLRTRFKKWISSSEAKHLGSSVGAQDYRVDHEGLQDTSSYLMAPSAELAENAACPVTRFMFYIWRSRSDLSRAFDLHNPASRLEYCKWFLLHASREYELPAEAYPQELLTALSNAGDRSVAEKALEFINAKKQAALEHQTSSAQAVRHVEKTNTQLHSDGANLIGYARGEFGMGEHVRMSARSFAAEGIPFSVINHAEVGAHGAADASIESWIGGNQIYTTNIFHINADLLPPLYYRFGKNFFEQHYNIGYWAWELSKCPPEFDLALNMVDEVWTISEFVREALKTRSPVPVINMSMAVSIPELQRSYSKAYFKLPEDSFLFLSIFDAASFLDRKNPIATVRAFKVAFSKGDEKVRLVLKTMNVPSENPLWQALMDEIRKDARISVISGRMTRDEVLGLSSVCDTLVSLHRSEGFGLCMAESMLLGKPVIATNYSGSREFAREETACVVDYKLVPVAEGSYPSSQGQEWAEPDIEHAAYFMSKLIVDENFHENIARAGQRFVKENLNVEVIGRRYAARFNEIKQRAFSGGQG
jgi:glycosyltransferase involved in cell wall biosynthesis